MLELIAGGGGLALATGVATARLVTAYSVQLGAELVVTVDVPAVSAAAEVECVCTQLDGWVVLELQSHLNVGPTRNSPCTRAPSALCILSPQCPRAIPCGTP